MSTMAPLTPSPILRQSADARIEEFNHAKKSFEQRYHHNPLHVAETDPIKRTLIVLENIKKLDPELSHYDEELKLATTSRCLEQAKHDPSVKRSNVQKYEAGVWKILNKHLARMEISAIHIELITEAMNADSSAEHNPALQIEVLDDEFELVEDELEEAIDSFGKIVSTVKHVDEKAIETYLANLFKDNCRIEQIQSAMQDHGNTLMEHRLDVEQNAMIWVIMDLIQNATIDENQKKLLEGYLQSPIALRELAATINMRSFRHRDYKDSQNGLSVIARPDSEGQYQITVQQDLLDTIFLHCTAITWASKLKQGLKRRTSLLRSSDYLDLAIVSKRDRYLTSSNSPSTHCAVPPPPPNPFPNFGCPPPPMPMVVPLSSRKTKRKPMYNAHRRRNVSRSSSPPRYRAPILAPAEPYVYEEKFQEYFKTFFMWRLPSKDGDAIKAVSTDEVQANLIKTLAVEAKLGAALEGQIHVYAPSFKKLTSSLPHKTIVTVLKYLGIPEPCLDFFTRSLKTKLNLGAGKILDRACGLSVGYGLEMFFTEALLFFLEYVVYQKTSQQMYRSKDKCYIIGSKEECRLAEEATAQFTEIMGLELDERDATGSLAIGFLVWNTQHQTFEIDNTKVVAYANSIKKQLEASTTVLGWIRTWNNTAGTYAEHYFGPLADVFGQKHVENVKAAYRQIYAIVLDDGDLTTHVRRLLKQHLKGTLPEISSVFETFIYLPQAYGGLGIQNPFITMNLAHTILADPDAEIKKYSDAEDAYYQEAKANWEAQTLHRKQQLCGLCPGEQPTAAERTQLEFPSKVAITAHRRYAPYPVLDLNSTSYTAPHAALNPLDVYNRLKQQPTTHVEPGAKLSDYIDRLSGLGDKKDWDDLSGQDRWVLAVYSEECFEHFGTVNIWWEDGVPTEVYKALRGCVWDDGGDDDVDDSASDTTI
ncbi:hypothetical protein ACN47E_002131 [Coniothyrium glycines]